MNGLLDTREQGARAKLVKGAGRIKIIIREHNSVSKKVAESIPLANLDL